MGRNLGPNLAGRRERGQEMAPGHPEAMASTTAAVTSGKQALGYI